MKSDLPRRGKRTSNGTTRRPTTEEVVGRLDALWSEERDLSKSTLPTFIPRRIGRYDVQCLIGRGSFGIVCHARDELLNRDVALKLPRPEVLDDAERMARFESEARIAAALDHPGIVPLYEADLQGDQPFLASAFCSGPDLGQWLQQQSEPLHVTDAVLLMLHLAEAITYAHEQGVVHRDLKPTNILLQSRDGDVDSPSSLAQAIPRITDFGLAKSLESELADTRSSMMIGTPLYMAPEQLDSGSVEAGNPSVDIYALGCILFELLTGRTPTPGETYVHVVDALRTTVPPKLRTIRVDVSRDLENVCAKCLEKRPADRYTSVAGLASDLTRLLDGQEVLARPVSLLRRAYRQLSRRPLLTLSTTLAVASFLSVAVLSSRYASNVGEFKASLRNASADLEASRKTAAHLNDSLEDLRYADHLAAAYDAFEKGDHVGARALLTMFPSDHHRAKTFGWQVLNSLTSFPDPIVLRGHKGPVREVVKVPGKRQLVSVGDDGAIRIWDCDSGAAIDQIQASRRPLSSLAVASDGNLVATGNSSLSLWDLATKQSKSLNVFFGTTIEEAAFSANDEYVACGARNRGITVLDLKSDQRVELDTDSGNEALIIQEGKVYGIHNGKLGRRLYAWDLTRGNSPQRFPAPAKTNVSSAALCNQQELFAIGNLHRGEVVLCELADGAEIWRSTSRPDSYTDITFTPDDAILLAGSRDGALCGWSVADCLAEERPLRALEPTSRGFEIAAHDAAVTSICSIDNSHIATSSEDSTVKLWSLPDPRYRLTQTSVDAHHIESIPGSQDHVIAYVNRDLERVDAETGRTLWRVEYHRGRPENERLRGRLRVSRSGKLVAGFGVDFDIDVLKAADGMHVFKCKLGNTTKAVDFSPHDQFVAATGVDGYVSVWDLSNGEQVFRHRLPGWGLCIRFSPDGNLLAVGGNAPGTLLINTSDWTVRNSLTATSGTTFIAFDPIRDEAATAHRDGVVRLWNRTTSESIARLQSDSRSTSLDYHPSDSTLAVAGGGGVVLWDMQTRRRLGEIWPQRRQRQLPMIQFDNAGDKLTCFMLCDDRGQRITGLLELSLAGTP